MDAFCKRPRSNIFSKTYVQVTMGATLNSLASVLHISISTEEYSRTFVFSLIMTFLFSLSPGMPTGLFLSIY